MTEAEIQRVLAFLCEVGRDVSRYNKLDPRRGIHIPVHPLNLRDAKPPSREVQEKWEAARKAEEAERDEAKGILFVHLIRLYKNVYGLFDAIEDTQDAAKKARLEQFVDTAVQWMNQIESALGGSSYDTLGPDNTPVESPDRSRCHARLWLEQWAAKPQAQEVVFCPEEALVDLPCKDYGEYEDKELAWVVNASYRTIVQLDHWVKEEMTEKVLHYYIYNRDSCQHRIITIVKNMDNLITHWQYYKPELSKNLSRLYDALQNAAKQTDKHYRRLSVLPYWNEKDYNPKRVKQCAAELHDKLLHIASMAYDELEKEENPAETEQKVTATKKEKGNVNVVNISANKVRVDKLQQSGHDSYIHKQTEIEEKKSGSVKKILKIIVTIVVFLAALFTCLGYLFGWLGPIKTFIYRIVSLN